MSKHKKTRQQKIIADLNRKLQASHVTSPEVQSHHHHTTAKESLYTYTSHTPIALTASQSGINNLVFIKHDLVKTTIVTCALLISQLLLLHLLKIHIIMIPMVRY